jgi:ATP-dependent Clp protease ATP-binding subunit ClpA
MTSNLGAADAERNSIGFGNINKDIDTKDSVDVFFAPEFRNRLDAVIKFGKLDHATMIKIVKKFINDLNVLTKDKNIHVALTDDAVEHLVKKGFDPKMGARPLQRAINENIKLPLSKEMLFGKLINGGVVEIAVEDDQLKINVLDIFAEKNIIVPEDEDESIEV